jgi:type IV fimbrial biogenesis protein FimT
MKQHGLSLVESVVTLGVVAGSLQFAVPAVQDWLQSASLNAASQELYTDLQIARTEAIKRNRRVALCKSADGASCSNEGGWEQGWIVFDDENNNGKRDAGEEVVRRREALGSALRVRGNQMVADYISYTPLGATKSRTGAFQAGTVVVCRFSGTPTPSREVVINAIGRPRMQRATADSCL